MSQVATGLRAWLLQRVSAIYLAVFFCYLLYIFIALPPVDYAAWREFVARPANSIAILLAYVSLLLHAWVGIRDVLIDYVHSTVVRFTALLGFGMLFMASGLWALVSIVLAQVGHA